MWSKFTVLNHQRLRKHAKLKYWLLWQQRNSQDTFNWPLKWPFFDIKSIGVLACLIPPTADFQGPEPVTFRTAGCQVRYSMLQPLNQATEVDQRYLLPDPKSCVILLKSSMTRRKIKSLLTLERHLIDGDTFEQRGVSRQMPTWLMFFWTGKHCLLPGPGKLILYSRAVGLASLTKKKL